MAVVEVPDAFRQSPRWWHDPAGRRWLDDLPGLVAVTCIAWGLTVDGPVRHGSNALVVPVRSGLGPAALRLTPGDAGSAADLRALQFWSGGPVVGVIRASPDGAIMLLDRLDASTPLSTRAPAEIAEVLGGLVAAMALTDPPDDVPSTTDVARAMAAQGLERWLAVGRPLPKSVMQEACSRASELVADDPGLAVNADVHADQVLSGRGGSWVVVDPTLWRGDPAYDLARAVWTLADRLPDVASLRAFGSSLVRSTGFDADRTRAWMLVRTVDYWLWCAEGGLTEDPRRCARVVDALRRA
ncbi:MAG: aminoglycoside phosphotransferase family protein [Lapillicoccus sp.]